MAFSQPGSPTFQPAAKTRRTRLTAPLAIERPAGWTGGEVALERVGLYRRFTLGAAQRGWRLAPQDVEILLDIYLAYVRRVAEPSPDTCLRTFRRLRRAGK